MIRVHGDIKRINLPAMDHKDVHGMLYDIQLSIHADYVGTACAVVESQLKTKCLFLQGGCGNINPYMDKTPLDQGGVEEMRKMGRTLGDLLTKSARNGHDGAGSPLDSVRSPADSRPGPLGPRES